MTDEEYLATRPEMTKDEILERNVEFLGSYLFNILNPKDSRWFDKDKAVRLDTGLYKSCVEVLYERGFVDEVAFMSLMDLLKAPFIPDTQGIAESKIREIVFPDAK